MKLLLVGIQSKNNRDIYSEVNRAISSSDINFKNNNNRTIRIGRGNKKINLIKYNIRPKIIDVISRGNINTIDTLKYIYGIILEDGSTFINFNSKYNELYERDNNNNNNKERIMDLNYHTYERYLRIERSCIYLSEKFMEYIYNNKFVIDKYVLVSI